MGMRLLRIPFNYLCIPNTTVLAFRYLENKANKIRLNLSSFYLHHDISNKYKFKNGIRCYSAKIFLYFCHELSKSWQRGGLISEIIKLNIFIVLRYVVTILAARCESSLESCAWPIFHYDCHLKQWRGPFTPYNLQWWEEAGPFTPYHQCYHRSKFLGGLEECGTLLLHFLPSHTTLKARASEFLLATVWANRLCHPIGSSL